MVNAAEKPGGFDSEQDGWDYAVLDLSHGPPRVQFSNGQPDWIRVNGRRLSWHSVSQLLSRLEDDGWLLAGVEHNRTPGIFRSSLRPSAYRYRRPAPGILFEYREVICDCTAQNLRFHPGSASDVQAAFSFLPASIEPCIEAYLRQGWERDPYPSAVDPQLTSHPLGLGGRWTVQAVKVRLRRPANGVSDLSTGEGSRPASS